jgi:hypothetical protein
MSCHAMPKTCHAEGPWRPPGLFPTLPQHILSILKKEIKDKINVKKIIFYIFTVLNAQISK